MLKTRSSYGVTAACAMALLLIALSPNRASARPALLDAEAGCELWLGTASGNDRSVRINLRLCRNGDAVTGQLQWSSRTSGWNVRTVTGQWNGDTLTARDTGIVEERPNPGWYFCLVDPYTLHRTGDRMAGTYRAPECNDNATLQLRRIASPDAAPPEAVDPGPTQDGPNPGNTLPAPQPTEVPVPNQPGQGSTPTQPTQTPGPPPPLPSSGGCGCSTQSTAAHLWGAVLLFLPFRRQRYRAD